MLKPTWLIVALLLSWSLNVALGVALFLKTKFPQGAQMTELHQPPPIGRGIMWEMQGPPHHREHMQEMSALRSENRRLMLELAEEWSKEFPDSIHIKSLADSLEKVNITIHRNHIRWMSENHSQIPSEVRRELSPRMMNRLKEQGMNREPRGQGGRIRFE